MGTLIDERPVRRRHRYILRTADKGDLLLVHSDAVARLDDGDRSRLLRVLVDAAAASRRIGPQHCARLATCVVLAERRQPGVVLAALPDDLAERLADAVLDVPESAVLIVGYEEWDGREPQPAAHPAPATEHHRSGWDLLDAGIHHDRLERARSWDGVGTCGIRRR